MRLVLSDEQLERMHSFWLRDGQEISPTLARDMVSLVEECRGRRKDDPIEPRSTARLTEDEALLALADSCSPVPSPDACREFTALRRVGWTVEWTLDDHGFLIVAVRAERKKEI